VNDPRGLVDKFARKPVSAIVEHVRDGSTVRVLLTPTNHYITLMMSGVRVSSPAQVNYVDRFQFRRELTSFASNRPQASNWMGKGNPTQQL